MKAPYVLLVLALALAACAAPAATTGTAPPTAAPATQAVAAATPRAPASPLPPTAIASAVPLSASSAATRLPAPLAESVPFSIGIPAGDAYSPYALAVDPSRELAYVYHADSVEKRPVISVVDLAAGRVSRLIRLKATTPGASGRLFLTPDGKRLFLQESADNTLLTIETATGSVRKLLSGVRDAVLSDDGRVLYAAQGDSVAAYSAAELMLGKTEPTWQVPGRTVRLALNGDRLLAARYGSAGSLVVLDTATGKQAVQGDAPETADALAAGPAGGWAIVIGGEKPRLIRYDADLKLSGETPAVYTDYVTYDAARGRYLVGGVRYGEAEPAGHPVILSIDAASGRLLDEQGWSAASAPTIFAPWRGDALVGLAAGGPAMLSVLDAATLTPTSQIPTGVRIQAAVIDDATQRLYVADDLGRVHVLKLPSGEAVAVWEGSAPIALDASNGRLYVNRAAGVAALDAATGALLAQFPQSGDPAPDPNADLVYIAERGVTMYDRSGKKLGALPSTFPVEHGFVPNPYAIAARVNPVTGHVAVVLDNGIPGSNGGTFLRIYPRQSDKAVEPAGPHSFVMDLEADRQGHWYVAYSTARNQEGVQVLTPDGQPLRSLAHRTGYVVLDDARGDLYLLTDGRVTQLAASTLTAAGVREGPDVAAQVAFSPSSRVAYVVNSSNPRITAVPLDFDKLAPLDLSPVPGRPGSEAYNEGVAAVGGGSQRLVLGRYGTAYRTTDGAAWQQLLPSLEMYYSHVTAVDPRTIFVAGRSNAGGEGVWRSTDGGDTWSFLAAGLTDLAPAWPVLANRDEAYFANQGQGLLRWDPAGRWVLASAAPSDGQWSSLSLAPDGVLFRSNGGRLERSTDKGVSWQKLGATENTGDVIGYSASYTATHTLFSVVRKDYRVAGIKRSTDGGKTWVASLSGPLLDFDGYQPEIASGFGRTYLLLRPYSRPPTLLRTTDSGLSWQAAPPAAAAGVDHLAVDPVDGRLWLGAKGGVRALEPDKLSWQAAPAKATPTPAPTSTVIPCSKPLSASDAEISARVAGIGCPKGPAATVGMARQRFQNGQMIWREDLHQVYVLYKDGRWEGYADKWVDGDPADDPSLAAPAGLQQPMRGFGKVWREQLGGPESPLGWALDKEQGVEGLAQTWEHAMVLRFGGEAIALFDGGAWR